ncbi:MAG: chemotaxis response regulator protein-glutamate methylesterase [Prolixibacteraceae bacterium]|jgi:two-component system chemotaxis response regulator CheB|nr:chemotaxis response regulator protein-glutamate methylesterase [Prolixibacteraceae bacterium]
MMREAIKNKKIKVLVIDDSVIFRRVLANAVESDIELDLIGTAADPFKAVEIIEKIVPDVITLDIEMPHMNGLTFLDKLMKQYPIPVIMVSSITQGNKEVCMDAFQKGAIDIINKPGKLKSNENLYDFYSFVCEKIKGASKANIVQKRKLLIDLSTIKNQTVLPIPILKTNEIIAIGASAGGTTAIEYILRALPANMPGILITQHMPKGFTNLFANRLNDICALEVREAQDRDSLHQGVVLIAQGGKQMELAGTIGNYRVAVTDAEPVNRHRPSVDVLFNSVARIAKTKATGVILTGMGADGAKGLLNMKNAGAYTVAQDKETSVVYGMPYQAALLNAHNEILSLPKIPKFLIDQFKK